MKKQLALVLCAGLLALAPAWAQRSCGSVEYQQMEELANPEVRKNRQEIERNIAGWLSSPVARGAQSVITIPVVVHVVYANSNQNISDAMVLAQINKLNEDFRKLNSDAALLSPSFAALAADTEIEFCLAQRDPAGNPTTGITRTQTTVSSFSTNNGIKSDATGGKTGWDRNKYLNLWVGNLGGGLLGYAQFPGGAAATDGVVVLFSSLPGGSAAPYNKGRTATHEIGHWLNLRHIWGDDGNQCTGSDLVADTPNQAGPSGGCFSPGFVKTDACTPTAPGVMWMNYMDYTDDNCMYMFTAGQKDRMIASINASRASLLTSNGCQGLATHVLDASIASINTPGASACAGSFSPEVTLRNMGTATLTSVNINYSLNGGATNTFAWTGSLASMATANVTLPAITVPAGNHTISVSTSSPNNGTDGNTANDGSTRSFSAVSQAPGIIMLAPEGFEDFTFPPANFTIVNPDNQTTWERTTSASKTGAASMMINNYSYNAAGEKDDLILPNIDLSALQGVSLTFQVAHKAYGSPYMDTLQVLISTNCGQSFTPIYYKGGLQLATGQSPLTLTSAFTPTEASHWRKETIDLSPYNSSNSATIIFRSITGYGNNLFLDDIMIEGVVGRSNDLPLGNLVSVYPNPSTGMVSVKVTEELAATGLNLQIVDVLGRVVATETGKDAAQHTYTFDLTSLPNGVYMARVSTGNASTVQRFVIAR